MHYFVIRKIADMRNKNSKITDEEIGHFITILHLVLFFLKYNVIFNKYTNLKCGLKICIDLCVHSTNHYSVQDGEYFYYLRVSLHLLTVNAPPM